MLDLSCKSKWLMLAAIFAICVGPTFISYRPYFFKWDDSYYLRQSLAVNWAFWSGVFWSGNVHGIGVVGIRPPAMALLALPWGRLAPWDLVGKCFITLAVAISALASFCFYLLLRIGVKPVYVIAASVCVFASLGPLPPMGIVQHEPAHSVATAFLADSLLAWTALTALLLIPYEAGTYSCSVRNSFARGTLWALVLSLGVMTKFDFLYFVAFVVPILVFLRMQRGGLRNVLAASIALAFWSAPSAIYLVIWGRPAFENAEAASFGHDAAFYYIPLLSFLGETLREAPGLGLSFLLTVGALAWGVISQRSVLRSVNVLPLLIISGFGIIVLAAGNKQIRYAFPLIVALPFLTAVLISSTVRPTSVRSAAFGAGLVFCFLLAASVPTQDRPQEQSISWADAVLAEAEACDAKRVVLATDSPTLNRDLMELAIEISKSDASRRPFDIEVTTMAYRAMSGTSLAQDLQMLKSADLIVFQDRALLTPSFTNRRVTEYQSYVLQGNHAATRIGNGLEVYRLGCAR